MNLPYVIDNREHRLTDVLDALLRGDTVHALDIATDYFNVGAYQLLQTRLERLASLTLLQRHEAVDREGLGLHGSIDNTRRTTGRS